jgi:glycosyltransferase involved in cell wall biosynthesis
MNKIRNQLSPIGGSVSSMAPSGLDMQGSQTCKKMRSDVCLAMPMYNQTKFLTEALQSLLCQTYRDFRLIIVDDSTELAPGEIARQFAIKDNRITYIKNESRKGMVDNWKACFQHAGPVDYFAWVSDHDVWHPEWLESLTRVLNTKANVVLVYPETVFITAEGQAIAKKQSPALSTDGLSAGQRIKTVCLGERYFGKKVYGLFRADALRKAGIFRRLLFPDVILLCELCLLGNFMQVDAELWYMRRMADFSVARQRESLFVRKPWYIFLPWPFVNAFVLMWNTALRLGAGSLRHRFLGLTVALMYLQRWLPKLGRGSRFGSYHQWRKGTKQWIKKLRRQTKSLNRPPD